MYRAEVRALLHRLGRAAGLPADLAGSLSRHAMRHAFATLNQLNEPAPAFATCRTPWATPPLARPGDTSAAAATSTAHPATCSRDTSAATPERVPVLVAGMVVLDPNIPLNWGFHKPIRSETFLPRRAVLNPRHVTQRKAPYG